jgi:hypothetical protein
VQVNGTRMRLLPVGSLTFIYANPSLVRGQFVAKPAMQSLAGQHVVNLVIERFDESALKAGVDSAQVRAHAATRLRQSGIEVSDRGTPGILRIAFGTYPADAPSSLYGVRSDCDFSQGVRTVAAPSRIIMATTWQATGMVGQMEASGIRTFVSSVLDGCLDKFIDAWQTANPNR